MRFIFIEIREYETIVHKTNNYRYKFLLFLSGLDIYVLLYLILETHKIFD